MRIDPTTLTEIPRSTNVACAPDGSWLAVSVSRLATDESSFVTDLWRIDIDGDGNALGKPVKLTWSDASDKSPRFRSDGSLGFLSARCVESDADDAARSQVWLLPKSGGEPQRLTDEPLGVDDFRFATRADRLVVLASVLADIEDENQRTVQKQRETRGESALLYRDGQVRHWDHWVRSDHVIRFVGSDGSGGNRHVIASAAGDEFRGFNFGLGWDLSPDGGTIVSQHYSRAADRLIGADLIAIPIESESGTAPVKWRRLTSSREYDYAGPRFSAAGDHFVCVAEKRPEGEWHKAEVFTFDIKSGSRTPHAIGTMVPSAPIFGPGDDSLVFSAAHFGDEPVFNLPIGSSAAVRATSQAAAGSHDSLICLPSGNAIVGIRSGLLQPPEVFACSLAAESEPRVISTFAGAGAGSAIAEAVTLERHQSKAADGSDIHWFLLKPSDPLDATVQRATELWIHGGPLSQWQDSWHWRWNPLVSVFAGRAVCMPNPRGSTGHGAELANGIWNNEWGAQCYTDLMTVTDDLAARADVDENRLVALGGSFGGYMANWIGGNTDRFKAIVSHAGIFNFPAFYGTTDHPPYWRVQMQGDPYAAPEAFSKYSPHRFVDNWKTPVLVIHGELDYRVPISEALLLFEALRDRNVDAEMLIFPNETHWILRPHNSRRWYREVLRFVEERLASS